MKAGWQVRPVGEVADHCLGKMLDKHKNKGTLRPYLRNINVRWFEIDTSDMLEMRFEEHESDRYTAVRGDVLICEGGYPGRAAIWDQDEPVYFQKALHRVRFPDAVTGKWLVYYLQMKNADGSLAEHFTGTGIQHFTGKALANFSLPLPPIEEQHQIVAMLDEAFEGLACARANIEAQLRAVDKLGTSVLSRAFSGELT